MSINCVDSRLITTQDGRIYRKADEKHVAGGVLVGLWANKKVKTAIREIGNKPFARTLCEECRGNNIFRSAAERAFANSPLKGRGVEFINAVDVAEMERMCDVANPVATAASALNTRRNILFKLINKIKQLKLSKKISDRKILIRQTVDGNNAFYSHTGFANQKIFVNLDRNAQAAFHEMGHAMNRNFSKIGCLLQNVRHPAAKLCSVALASALLIRKKEKGEKPKNFLDKAGMFLKNNCGLIAAAGYLPTIAEEALASYNGRKIAAQFLSAENLKKLKVYNSKALLTYIATGIGITAGVIVASKIRDLIAKPKEVKA